VAERVKPALAVLPAATARSGGGRLHVESIDGMSAATTWHASDPLKLMLPRPRARAVWACAATYGGGLVAGDAVDIDLAVGPGAALFLGTQATTKVYRSTGATARQTITASVAAGGLLAVLPEPVSCFADSRYAQRVVIDLAEDASLAWLDAVSAGRVACGERWGLDSYDSRTDLRLAGRLLLRDTLRLDRRSPLLDRFGPHVVSASLILAGPLCSDAVRLATTLTEQHVPGADGVLVAASPLHNGCLLRLAAVDHEALAARVRAVIAPLSQPLDGDPWRRLASVELPCI
jgi:urease accessory protein